MYIGRVGSGLSCVCEGVGAHIQLLCEGTVFGLSKKAALNLQSCAAGVGGALIRTVCIKRALVLKQEQL